MRSLQFRAWEEGKMKYFNLRDLLIARVSCGSGYDKFPWMHSEDVPIMQFTGAVDKKNRGIYEEDIVLDNSFSLNIVGTIRYMGSSFWFFSRNSNDRKILHNLVLERAEVIGNTYEAKP